MRARCFSKDATGFMTFGTEGGRKQFKQWDGIDWKEDAENRAYLQGVKPSLQLADLTPAAFWHKLFGTCPPLSIDYVESSVFAVQSTVAHRRSRSFYEKLLKVFTDSPHVNPEYGHYIERFWEPIFRENL